MKKQSYKHVAPPELFGACPWVLYFGPLALHSDF